MQLVYVYVSKGKLIIKINKKNMLEVYSFNVKNMTHIKIKFYF